MILSKAYLSEDSNQVITNLEIHLVPFYDINSDASLLIRINGTKL